ncbi:MAG: hypothetical protein AB7Q64_24245, partial [Verrucomicrobiales bacterium]
RRHLFARLLADGWKGGKSENKRAADFHGWNGWPPPISLEASPAVEENLLPSTLSIAHNPFRCLLTFEETSLPQKSRLIRVARALS